MASLKQNFKKRPNIIHAQHQETQINAVQPKAKTVIPMNLIVKQTHAYFQ